MQRSVRHSAASPHKMPQASSGTAGITVSSDPRFAIGSNLEQLGYEGGLGPHVASIDLPKLPLPHHCHHLVACQCSSGFPEAAEAEPWSDQATSPGELVCHLPRSVPFQRGAATR